MFERYTEKARRVVFFARYEASQFGSPFIETEHLLLGILRENKELMRHVLRSDFDSVRQQITAAIKLPAEPIPTSVDIPLSDHCKRALTYAKEEADRLNHRQIGTPHLLLGLVRDEQFSSAIFLSKFGVTIESLRDKIQALGEKYEGLGAGIVNALRSHLARHPQPSPATVEIHGVKRDLEQINAATVRFRTTSWHWQKKRWKPRDIVVNKEGKMFSFDLRLARRSSEFAVVRGGWKKDYCAICSWEMFESSDPSHSVAFTNGRDWICPDCHQKFIVRNFFGSPYSDLT